MLRREIAFAASPAVIFEYEDILKRTGALGKPPVASAEQVDLILDALCTLAEEALPWFRFRPFLDDPRDDLFIECALAAGARLIVTDDKHFRHPSLLAFGLRAASAKEFVSELRHERKPK
jgi:hypothetical protein